MADRTRLRRQDPTRTQPIRDWSTLLRRPGAWGEPAGDPGQAAPLGRDRDGQAVDDPVAYGVELGYRVVDEHIRQGQRVAAELRSGSYVLADAGGDLQELTARTLRYAGELATMWIEVLGSLASRGAGFGIDPSGADPGGRADPGARSGPASSARSHTGSTSSPSTGTAAGEPDRGVDVAVAIDTPARVSVHLDAGARAAALVTHGLRSVSADSEPLTQIEFETDATGAVSVRIRVPAGQPPGCYSGVVVDRDSGRPHGLLTVDIAAPEAP
ncbi:hypothetical protein [Haliangium sp.]|uniref:hypothetical protein n=1 Tax=Haliangium sp. TaxID=2663208 RepID=UPI003D0FE8A3